MIPATSHSATVTSLYLAFLGRPPDPDGLAFWSQQLAAFGGASWPVVEAFARSEEAQVRFGTDAPAARIGAMYEQLFDRAPDDAGLAFWVGVVEQGKVTLAEVAVAMLAAAQGSDAQLVALRQQAATDFTARIETTGSDYAGYAAVEAGRVLVHAVTANASAQDVTRAVDAAVSLADTASHHAAVIAALARDGALPALFDGARGRADPVALAEVLAGIADAGADSPAMLARLLKDGGMAGVLAALPARYSLQDLVDVLAADGLAGVIGMVYPDRPGTPSQPPQPPEPPEPEPPQSLTLAFAGIEQGELDEAIDHVTNLQHADITFSIDNALRAGQHVEYRIGGGAWLTDGVQVDAGLVVIQGPDLIAAAASGGAAITVRVVDAVHGEIATASHGIVLDLEPPALPALQLAIDTGLSASDAVTRVATVLIDGLDADPGTRWEYSLDGGGQWLPGDANVVHGAASLDLSGLAQGSIALQVRQVDAAGNAGQAAMLDFTYDTVAPTERLAYRGIVGEPAGALTTRQPNVDIVFGVTNRLDGIVQWRFQGQSDWTTVERFAANGNFTLEDIDLTQSDPTIELRVIDLAGNVGATMEPTIDGPYSPFSVTLDRHGLWIESTVAGALAIGGVPVVSKDATGGAIDGRVLVGVQAQAVRGTLTLTPDGGGPVQRDPSGRSYELGGAGSDTLGGNYQWGFEGEDTLEGTTGDDYLFGGGDFDTIYSRGGSDVIQGGSLADRIVLVADGKFSTLVYTPGEAYTGEYQEGIDTMLVDRIEGAEAGDAIQVGAIFGAMPAVGSAYLAGNTPDRVAIVRGHVDADGFRAHAAGTSYMVQWNGLDGIHSIVFDNYAGRRMGLDIDVAAGRMTLTEPPPDLPLSAYTGFTSEVGLDEAFLRLEAAGDDVAATAFPDGLLTAGGLQLRDYTRSDFTDVTATYASREGFGVKWEGHLDLGGPLRAGIYMMRWDEHTFATVKGALAGDVIMFAGGVGGMIVQDLFELDVPASYNGGVPVGRPIINNSIMRPFGSGTTVTESGGHDVIAEDGAFLTIAMGSAFSDIAPDMVLGFDGNDRIRLHSTAGDTVDREIDGIINWVQGAGKVVVGAQHEAARITTVGLLATGQLADDASATLDTLRNHLDVSGLDVGDGLFILARDAGGDSAMLLYYQDQDGNGEVNAPELVLIGTFFDGAPETAQIVLG